MGMRGSQSVSNLSNTRKSDEDRRRSKTTSNNWPVGFTDVTCRENARSAMDMFDGGGSFTRDEESIVAKTGDDFLMKNRKREGCLANPTRTKYRQTHWRMIHNGIHKLSNFIITSEHNSQFGPHTDGAAWRLRFYIQLLRVQGHHKQKRSHNIPV